MVPPLLGSARLLLFDAKDATFGGEPAGDLDLGADERIEQSGGRSERIRSEGKVAEQLDQRRLARQAHCANGAFLVEYG